MKTITKEYRTYGRQFTSSQIDEAHRIYKSRNGEYGRNGGFTNKGPLMAINNNLWQSILNEIYKGII